MAVAGVCFYRCLSVCLVFCTMSLKPIATIIKLDIQMFHDESWKPVYFGINRSKVKVTSCKNSGGAGFLLSCECWLL